MHSSMDRVFANGSNNMIYDHRTSLLPLVTGCTTRDIVVLGFANCSDKYCDGDCHSCPTSFKRTPFHRRDFTKPEQVITASLLIIAEVCLRPITLVGISREVNFNFLALSIFWPRFSGLRNYSLQLRYEIVDFTFHIQAFYFLNGILRLQWIDDSDFIALLNNGTISKACTSLANRLELSRMNCPEDDLFETSAFLLLYIFSASVLFLT